MVTTLETEATYLCVLTRLYLLCKTHEQHIGAVGVPVIVQLLFCLAPNVIVARLESLEELGKSPLHLSREQ